MGFYDELFRLAAAGYSSFLSWISFTLFLRDEQLKFCSCRWDKGHRRCYRSPGTAEFIDVTDEVSSCGNVQKGLLSFELPLRLTVWCEPLVVRFFLFQFLPQPCQTCWFTFTSNECFNWCVGFLKQHLLQSRWKFLISCRWRESASFRPELLETAMFYLTWVSQSISETSQMQFQKNFPCCNSIFVGSFFMRCGIWQQLNSFDHGAESLAFRGQSFVCVLPLADTMWILWKVQKHTGPSVVVDLVRVAFWTLSAVLLQAVNPVAMGKTRSRNLYRRSGDYAVSERDKSATGDTAMCLQIHGDAAFTAQVNFPL